MSHPHPYDVLIQAHREGGFLEERQLPIYANVDFDALHPIHKMPFVALLAAEPNSYDAIFRLLNENYALTYWPTFGAAMGNQAELLEVLLECTVESDEPIPDYEITNRNWAAFGAAKGGHVRLLTRLLKDGASQNFAVEGAAWAGNDVLMNNLLETGASRQSAIMGAARGNQTPLFKKLNIQEADYFLIIQGAASAEQDELLLEYLQKDIEVFDRWFHQILEASRSRNWATVENLLIGDVVIDRIHPKYALPVIALLAQEPNQAEAVYGLIEAGAQSRWAVLGAALGRQHALTNQLIIKGADINWAVDGAARCGDITVVNALLSAGANPTFAITGAALRNQKELLTNLLKELNQQKICVCIEHAAEGNHSELMWEWLNYCKQFFRNSLEAAFSFALSGAGRGGHRALAEKLLQELEKNSIGESHQGRMTYVLPSAIRGGHFEWVHSLLQNNTLNRAIRINRAVGEAALGGHLAMAYRFLPLQDLRGERRSYDGALMSAVHSGNLPFIDKFLPLQELLEEASLPVQRSSAKALLQASDSYMSAVVVRLLQAGIPIHCNVYKSRGSLIQVSSFLAGMDIQYRQAYVNGIKKSQLKKAKKKRVLPVSAFETSNLAIGFGISKLMDRYQLTAREAQVWYYHRDQLLQIWQLQKQGIGEIPSFLWQFIGCLVATTQECVLSTGEMKNIQSAIEKAFAEAHILCGPENNFDGNALFFWIQDCANYLKGRIWPAQQAKGVALETLLYQINVNLPGDTLNAELMLNGLQKQNNDGHTIRSLLESANLWGKLLKRFPAFSEQSEIQPTEKKCSTSLSFAA